MAMAAAVNVDQVPVTFNVLTVLVTWCIAINALWDNTSDCHFTELKCGMANISSKQHYITRALCCILDIMEQCVQTWMTLGWM